MKAPVYLKREDFPEGEWVLKSKRGMWYAPDNCGYTSSVFEAGLFEREEALNYCFYSRDGAEESNGSCGVYAVPLRDALRGYRRAGVQARIGRITEMLNYLEEE